MKENKKVKLKEWKTEKDKKRCKAKGKTEKRAKDKKKDT